jgi:uncharacterized protein
MAEARLPEELSDPGSLDDLEAAECWRLLATQPVGRVAIIVGHYPLIFPVNYALDGECVVFRTGPGAKLWAMDRSNVTFQADQIDVARRSGWSVMVNGSGCEVVAGNNPNLAARIEAGGATPWAPGARSHIVRIIADHISGRRIRPGELPTSPFKA